MVNIKSTKLGALLLAGSAVCAFQTAHAQSCNTTAWNGTSGTAVAGSAVSEPAVRRYTGSCGLSTSVPGYVFENTQHENEGGTSPLHVRFFVYPEITSGTTTVFQGLDAVNGNPVVQVHYNATNQRFEFQTPNGTASTSGTAPRAKWYRVALTYQSGNAISASVRGNGGTTYTVASPPLAGSGLVDEVRLGAISGASGTVFVDEYEASRAAGSEPTMAAVVRGDASGDGVCNVGDITTLARDLLFQDLGAGGTRALAPGQPDCDEDGNVNVGDITCFARRLIDFDLNDVPCN